MERLELNPSHLDASVPSFLTLLFYGAEEREQPVLVVAAFALAGPLISVLVHR